MRAHELSGKGFSGESGESGFQLSPSNLSASFSSSERSLLISEFQSSSLQEYRSIFSCFLPVESSLYRRKSGEQCKGLSPLVFVLTLILNLIYFNLSQFPMTTIKRLACEKSRYFTKTSLIFPEEFLEFQVKAVFSK